MERTIERVQKEHESYLTKLEEQKKKELKSKELQTKQYLDMQMQEKQAKNSLSKVQEDYEAKYVNKDV